MAQGRRQKYLFLPQACRSQKELQHHKRIHHQGQNLIKLEEIKNAAHSFYKDLFIDNSDDPPSMERYPLNVMPALIKEDENRMMIDPITTEEIYQALIGMNPDKAPGPDGFSASFYTVC